MADKKTLQNPFPGLRPFQSDEEHLFFGRETQTLELLQILRDNRFVGVIGTSGSGKSSLVRCGLLSELYGGAFLKAGTDWEVAVMNPGGGPFKQLSKSLVASDIYDSEEADVHLKLNATLRRSRLGLVEAIRQAKLPEGTNFLLVVDQFEEIFRYSEAGEEEGEAADDFISMILEAAKQSNIPIYVIITMRSDYIGDCSKFEGLPEEINEGEYLIPRLSREEYKSVIEGPVRVGGAKLAPRLLQRLLNDIGTESDQLPCLQHALMRTWDAWVERDEGEELDLEDYRAIGGMGKALSIHADEIFDTFTDKGTRETATRMFRAITEKGDDNRGIRRPLRLQQLADITNHSVEEVRSVVDPYRQQGVTFLTPPSSRELDPKTVIDISHESLMRVWGRLRNWVEEEAQSARIYRRLVDTSSLWKKEEAGLYHDPDLQIAQSWRDQYQPNKDWADLYGGGFEVATEFLEASEEEGRKAEREKELARQKELEQAQELAEARERSAKNMKRFAAVVGVVAVIALGAMGFAVKAQKAAELAQTEADKARESAEIAEENVKKEFARSDNSLGNSFADSNPKLALAHFSRSLEVDPNNTHAVDRSFNILAYQSPPLSQYVDPDLGSDLDSNQFITSTSNAEGTLIATSQRGSNNKLSLWDPMQKDPLIEISISNGNNFWYQGLDFSKRGNLLAVGFNQGDEGQIVQINEDDTYEIKSNLPSHLSLVKFSRDGSKLLTSSWKQKVIEICDSKTGTSIFSVNSGSWYPKWSPDEKSILLGKHQAKIAAVVEIETGETKEFKHEELIWHNAVFDPSGRKILTFGKPAPTEPTQNYYIWDVNSQEIDVVLSHNNVIIPDTIKKHNFEWEGGGGLGVNYSVGSFSPNSQVIITVATDQNIRLWSPSNGKLLDSLKIPKLPARDQNPLFSGDGNRMIVPLRDGTCYLFTFDDNYSTIPPLGDSVSLSKAYNFLKHENMLRGITYPLSEIISAHLNQECNLLFLGSKTGKAALFHAASGDQVDSTFHHPGEIHEVAISIDGTKFATASDLGTIKIWELGKIEPILEIGEPNHKSEILITKIHFSNDGNILWIHTPDGSTRLNILNGEMSDSVYSLTNKLAKESANGETFVTIKNQVITLQSDQNINFSANAGSPISSIDISHDSEIIAAGLSSGELKIWDVNSQTPKIFKTGSGIPIMSTSISPDNRYIAGADSSGKIFIFNILSHSNNEFLILEGDMACTDIKFNKNNNMIGAVFNDGTKAYSQVWDFKTGAAVTSKLTNDTAITNIEFSDNGNSIFVWSTNKEYPQNHGLCTKWDILVSEGLPSTDHYTSLISTLGGLKLDADSNPIRVNGKKDLEEFTDELKSDVLSNAYLRWQFSHPSNRSNSPFRENLSEGYLNKLSESNSIQLLSHAIRINPENKIALLKRGILRLSQSQKRGDSDYVLGSSDLQIAEKMSSSDILADWLSVIGLEASGDSQLAKKLYNNLIQSKISLDRVTMLIDLHKLTNAPTQNKIILINKAIEIAKKNRDEISEKKLIVRKFILSCSDQNYQLASDLWSSISNWLTIPEGFGSETLFLMYLKLVESEAERLLVEDKQEDAVKILSSAAIASLAQNPGQIPSTVTKLFEISSRENATTEIVGSNSEWFYLDDGIDQGTEWKQPWFIKEGWSKGAAKLGYGGDGEVTELSWGPNLNDKYPTYYFRHEFNLDEGKKFPFLLAKVVRDDGVVIYLNGKEVIRENMPDGEITHSTYASVTANESLGDESSEHLFQISGDYLNAGVNIIAASVHQVNKSSSDLGFQLTLTGSNQTPISLISDSLIKDKTGQLMERSVNLFPLSERNAKEELIKKLVTNYKLRLACEIGDYKQAKILWKEICAWEEWPEGVDKIELAKKVVATTVKHSKVLYDQGKTDQATKLLLPIAFSTLVNEDTSIDKSFYTLFKWSHPNLEVKNLLADDASWKYLDDGTDQGAEWNGTNFDDSNWKSGSAKLGYGGDGELTKLSYGDNQDEKIITYYFRNEFTFEGDSVPKILAANLVRDDGAIVYLNGKEIIRSNMPKGEVNFETLASVHASGKDELSKLSYEVDPKLLVKGKNILAVEIHQDDSKSSDIGMSMSLQAKELTVERYVYECLVNTDFQELLVNSFNYLPSSDVSNAKKAFRYALDKNLDIENELTNSETLQMTLFLLTKLKRFDDCERLGKLNFSSKSTGIESQTLSEHKEVLHSMSMRMKANGASDESLQVIRSMILEAPPRDPALPREMVDLSDYYNASLYHYGAFHGGGDEKEDLRFLPEKYVGDIAFDLRGVVRVDSGKIFGGSSANEGGWLKNIGVFYPKNVSGIKIEAEAKKIHFLMGANFAGGWNEGDTAAILRFNYNDGSLEELKLMANEDLFDWFGGVNQADLISEEKIGFLGTNFKGNSRLLTKPIWENPHPEKIISHIDFVSGLAPGCPFLIGITIE